MAEEVGYEGGVIRWEEPPEPVDPRQTRRPWALVAAQLRSRPGVSGLIDDQSNFTIAVKIRNGQGWWAPKGAFEATTRLIDGRIHVYAWYVGNTTDGQPS
jgi:hypothetical protein